jgi:hypothetical protein
MALITATGQATSLDGREAAAQATRQAIERLGKKTVAFGLVVASHHFQPGQVLGGITPLVGDAPLLGFSTPYEFAMLGMARRSVVVTLVSGSNLQARADWWPGFDQDSQGAARQLIQGLQLDQSEGTLLLAADGLAGNAFQMLESLPAGIYQVAGCLAGGDLRRGYTYQIGGKKGGSGGLAGALLSGDLAVGIGSSHAWQPVGAYFKVTGAQGQRLIELDQAPAHEAYARLFGCTPQEWISPPLNELARLYPLGIEQAGGLPYRICSPVRMEADGSLQMSAPVSPGSIGHLLLGGIASCIEAATRAAQLALANLGDARPVLGLVFADIAMAMLLEAQSGDEFEAVGAALGSQVPVIGGYTYGQISPTEAGVPELLNQHITVVVFGENWT